MNEKKAVYFTISEQLRRRFKAFCASNGVTMNDAITKILDDYLTEAEKK